MAISITNRAKNEFIHIIEEQKSQDPDFASKKQYLRIRVIGGGCSGFQYKLTVDDQINENLDDCQTINEINVVVDKRSIMYVSEAKIDYLDDLNERGFKIENPDTKTTCGCGKSFSF
jgi:iron-sulfur cluster assembly protein